MRKKIFLSTLLIFTALFNAVIAQENLVDFTITQIEINSLTISWTNPYSNTIQLSIQRSVDNKNFRTILSAQKPALLNNKMIDAPLPVGVKIYYRIYYVLVGGSFYFSKTLNTIDDLLKTEVANKHVINIKNTAIINQSFVSESITTDFKKKNIKKEVADDENKFQKSTQIKKEILNESTENIEPIIEYYYHTPIKNREIFKLNLNLSLAITTVQHIKSTLLPIRPLEYVFIYQKDSLIARIDPTNFLKYKDSIRLKTKDTLSIINKSYASIHRYIPAYIWKPSIFVFNTKKGEPTIQITTAKKYRYRLVFKDEKGLFLFQLSPIKEEQLFLDKSNFLHAGWFEFELYENEKLLEKNKIFIQL